MVFFLLYMYLSKDGSSIICSHDLGEILYRSRKSGFFVLDNNTCWLSSDRGREVSVGFFCVCGWLWVFFENDMESEFMVIQSRQQNELIFVFPVCDKILFNCKILSQVSCFFYIC